MFFCDKNRIQLITEKKESVMKLVRRNPDVVLLAGENRESEVIRKLLQERRINFAEITNSKHGLQYPEPTLFVRGTSYSGLDFIKHVINTNHVL